MAKRLERVAVSDLSGLLTKSDFLHFVMTNSAVVLARPLEIKSDQVKTKNTRGHILLLPISQIREIWHEEKATAT